MLQSFINAVFGCSHHRTTFPLTPGRKTGSMLSGVARNGTYVVCLDCGREFAYDWDGMRLGQPVAARMRATEAEAIIR